MIHAAKLENSPRLQRFYSVLRKGARLTTRQIIQKANVCNPNTCAAELNAPINNIPVKCKRKGKNWEYWIERKAA